jgi:hypothetical protein
MYQYVPICTNMYRYVPITLNNFARFFLRLLVLSRAKKKIATTCKRPHVYAYIHTHTHQKRIKKIIKKDLIRALGEASRGKGSAVLKKSPLVLFFKKKCICTYIYTNSLKGSAVLKKSPLSFFFLKEIIYIYQLCMVYVCVCVYIYIHTHTHTNTYKLIHIYIYIISYIYVCVYVCECICIYIFNKYACIWTSLRMSTSLRACS